MKYWYELPGAVRWTFCLLLVALSVLLAGAGRMSSSLESRRARLEEARLRSQETAGRLSCALPDAYRADWDRLAAEKPELCFRACHAGLSPAAAAPRE